MVSRGSPWECCASIDPWAFASDVSGKAERLCAVFSEREKEKEG
jgi:hypothetical protein